MDFSMFDLLAEPMNKVTKVNSPYTYVKSPARPKSPESPDSLRWDRTAHAEYRSRLVPPSEQHQPSSPTPSCNSEMPNQVCEQLDIDHSSTIHESCHLPNIARKSMVGPLRFWPKKYRPSRGFVANPDLQPDGSENKKLRRKQSLMQKPTKPLIRIPTDSVLLKEKPQVVIPAKIRKHLLGLTTITDHLPSPHQSAENTPQETLSHTMTHGTFEQLAKVQHLKSLQAVSKSKPLLKKKHGVKGTGCTGTKEGQRLYRKPPALKTSTIVVRAQSLKTHHKPEVSSYYRCKPL